MADSASDGEVGISVWLYRVIILRKRNGALFSRISYKWDSCKSLLIFSLRKISSVTFHIRFGN